MEKATVFARTKPNDKAKIVMVFQQMGKKVSMCGDGANDCGALKQADIGYLSRRPKLPYPLHLLLKLRISLLWLK